MIQSRSGSSKSGTMACWPTATARPALPRRGPRCQARPPNPPPAQKLPRRLPRLCRSAPTAASPAWSCCACPIPFPTSIPASTIPLERLPTEHRPFARAENLIDFRTRRAFAGRRHFPPPATLAGRFGDYSGHRIRWDDGFQPAPADFSRWKSPRPRILPPVVIGRRRLSGFVQLWCIRHDRISAENVPKLVRPDTADTPLSIVRLCARRAFWPLLHGICL